MRSGAWDKAASFVRCGLVRRGFTMGPAAVGCRLFRRKGSLMVDGALIERLRCNIPALAEFQDNIRIIEVEKPGFVRFTMDIPESLGNYRGGIHGGTGYFIGEIGCGFATYSLGMSNVCTSASINFIKAVPCCKVETCTEVVHAGRSTAVVRVSTYDAAEHRLLFQSTHNMFLFGPLEEEE